MADILRSVFTIILGIIPFTLVLCWSSYFQQVRTCMHFPYLPAPSVLPSGCLSAWGSLRRRAGERCGLPWGFPGFLSCQTSPLLAFKNLSKFHFWIAVLMAATSCALLEVEQLVCPACSWRSFLPFAIHFTCLHCDFSSQKFRIL